MDNRSIKKLNSDFMMYVEKHLIRFEKSNFFKFFKDNGTIIFYAILYAVTTFMVLNIANSWIENSRDLNVILSAFVFYLLLMTCLKTLIKSKNTRLVGRVMLKVAIFEVTVISTALLNVKAAWFLNSVFHNEIVAIITSSVVALAAFIFMLKKYWRMRNIVSGFGCAMH